MAARGRVATAMSRGMRSLSEKLRRLAAVVFFVFIEKLVVLSGLSSCLPPPLVGMTLLFMCLVMLDKIGDGSVAARVFQLLEPGYRFLLKWAPIFFTPALVKLPLVQEPISLNELFRIAVMIVLGGMLQMSLVALLATRLSAMMPRKCTERNDRPVLPSASVVGSTTKDEPYPRPGRPYKRRWLPAYALLMVVALAALRLASQFDCAEKGFVLGASLLAFVMGNSAPARFQALVHPIFSGVLGSWAGIALWASQAEGTTFNDALVRYAGPDGAGTIMSRLLNPLVVALALLLFERRRLLRRDSLLILGSAAGAAAAGLFGTALLARILQLKPVLAVSSVSRYCTAPLALAVASSLNASQPLAIAMVVASGFVGIFIARPLLNWLSVDGSRERGLAIGAVSHVLGTVSLASWDEAAVPYSALVFVITSGLTAALVAVPVVQNLLLWILGCPC
eukprot:TRINITY_DN24639_c0_g1_i2.p1 TRINITY_DN24639_c0_g1~~TRINITY_DN24639_c0_g1_i2.p1  ORF type:complete len:451 (+),score=75.51 TRINITY_DN24639_c0_g1_i2:26-1378(+)